MVRYEFQKMFGGIGGKIALLLYVLVAIFSCCLSATGTMNTGTGWVNSQGITEFGPAAIRNMQKAQSEWTGFLDQELLTRVVQENARINATPEAHSKSIPELDTAFGWKQGFAPIRDLISEAYAPSFRAYDYYKADAITSIRVETFYRNRVEQVKEWLQDNGQFSENEKAFILRQYESLQTPFYFAYHNGWYQLLENVYLIPTLGILILGFVLSGIFANESKWNTEAICFSACYGRTKAVSAKIRAGLLLITAAYWGAALIYTLFTLGYLGSGGGQCVVQLRVWRSLYNVTLREAFVLTLFSGYIGNLFLGALTMYISARTKSSVIAVTVPFVLIFFPTFLQDKAVWLDTLIGLLPASLLQFYQRLSSFQFLTLFGSVFREMDMCIPLYALLTLLLIPLMYREYSRMR